MWNGLIGAWTGLQGGGGTLYDLSGLDNHGTLTNMDPATDWVATEKGWGLDFDGDDDHIVIGQVVSGYPFTVHCLVKLDVADRGAIISIANNGNAFYHAILVGESDPDFVPVMRSYDGTVYDIGGAALVSGVWHSLTGIWASASSRLFYRDGVLQGVDANVENGNVGYTDTRIGITADSTPWEYSAVTMPMASIFSRALTPNEIQRLHVDPHALFRLRGRVIFAAGAAPPAGNAPTGHLYGSLVGPLGGAI